MIGNSIYKYLIITIIALAIAGCQEDKITPDLFGSLSGEVLFEDSNLPADGVSISTSPSSSSVLTDMNGAFELENIKVGTYTVRAELNWIPYSFRKYYYFRKPILIRYIKIEGGGRK